ncbi:MAG: hypothetical protein J2P19_00110 [Pseudonocardia sp.]|nr:hypothetical protein [Pseudonocardia sp.]
MTLSVAEAWALTRELSHRRHVRVGASGDRNEYAAQARVDGEIPDGPWALYLADEQRRFWHLAFDLDASGPVEEDVQVLTRLMDDVGIAHVLTASGPGRGRHMWVGLAVPLPAPRVAELARRLRRQLPSLDIAPLMNPDYGCVRPPGAPHRLAGASRVLAGDVHALLRPEVTPDVVDRLIAALPPVEDAQPDGPGVGAIAADADGRPRLRGLRRGLPATAEQALRTPRDTYAAALEPGMDASASAQLWRVLLGAVRARWGYRDIAALLTEPGTPGLDAIRTTPATASRPTRTPRSPEQQVKRLEREWARAVAHAARWCPSIDDGDRDFVTRAEAAVVLVAAVQARADASPGRWAQGGGPADRRVLDALCHLHLDAVADQVAIDIRRLGLRCGIGRETARTALQRLSDDGWTCLVTPAEGPNAAVWALTAPPAILSTTQNGDARSQAFTRPAGDPLDLRASWLTRLQTRLDAGAHDVFTPEGLGHLAGHLWQHLTTTTTGVPELAQRTGLGLGQVRHQLHRLERAGLARPAWGRLGWSRGPTDRDTAARHLGAAGVLEARASRYDLERVLWRWWTAEVEWLRLPLATKRQQHRVDANQRTLALNVDARDSRVVFGRYPRTDSGAPDHATAAAIVLDDRMSAHEPAAAAR